MFHGNRGPKVIHLTFDPGGEMVFAYWLLGEQVLAATGPVPGGSVD